MPAKPKKPKAKAKTAKQKQNERAAESGISAAQRVLKGLLKQSK